MRKVVGGFGKKSCVSTGVRKPGNTCVTDRHDMTLAVKVALNPNTTNQHSVTQYFRPWVYIYNKKKKHCIFNHFPNKPWILRVFSTSLLRTLWEKENLLVMSNFSIVPHCFLAVMENFLPFSTNLKLLSANSFSLGESKSCPLGKS